MLRGKKYIFFDLDGVLVETRKIHYEAFKDALNSFGIQLSEKEHKEKFDGLPTKIKLDILKDQYELLPTELSSIDKLKQNLTVLFLKEKITKDIELISLLTELKKSRCLCICSNARKDTINLTVESLGIKHLLDFTVSQGEVHKPKPSPDIFLKALKCYNAQNQECLIFEDSSHGIKAAIDAQIDYVKIKNPLHLKSWLQTNI